MAKVSVDQRERPRVYDPEIRIVYVGDGSCVASEVSWENPTTIAALGQMFSLKSDEILAAVTITKTGIRAEIKTQR